MDKLQEPEFELDKNWPRMLLGVEEMKKKTEKKFLTYFIGLSALSIFRYYREIYFYKGGVPQLFVYSAGFLFTSYQLAKYYSEDPFVIAAEQNNLNELKYVDNYKELYKIAKRKNLIIPDQLIK